MRKILLLLVTLLTAPIFVGCGGSDEFSGTTIQNNSFTSLLPNLSGQVGGLQLQTTLEPVNAQTISIVTTTVVPSVVDEFRFLGFNEDGVLIYGPVIRQKAASVTLEEVPVEVVRLRIELLTDGLIVGGLSTVVDINTGEVFVLNNPTFAFPQGAAGPQGPAGEDGEDGSPGAPGPEGPPVTTVYGSYSASLQSTDAEGDPLVNFETIFNQQGVTSLGQGESFQVSQAGDYLVTFTLVVLDVSTERFSVEVNGSSVNGASFLVGEDEANEGDLPLSYTASFILSLSADDQVSLSQDGGGLVNIAEGFFTIVRLGQPVE